MSSLSYTLITDGRSDRAFMPILNWLLMDLGLESVIKDTYADLSLDPYPPKSLVDKINRALELYPCNLLFVHRDAEKEPRSIRKEEIEQAVAQAGVKDIPVVCVIPVRMLEAWLLFDEDAIRQAAGNPKGKCKLNLPALNKVESLPDPKNRLLELLEKASELRGRQLKKFNSRGKIHRLANVIDDFSSLYQLSAFQELKQELLIKLSSRDFL